MTLHSTTLHYTTTHITYTHKTSPSTQWTTQQHEKSQKTNNTTGEKEKRPKQNRGSTKKKKRDRTQFSYNHITCPSFSLDWVFFKIGWEERCSFFCMIDFYELSYSSFSKKIIQPYVFFSTNNQSTHIHTHTHTQ